MGRWTKTAEKPSEHTFELAAYRGAQKSLQRDGWFLYRRAAITSSRKPARLSPVSTRSMKSGSKQNIL